jgi:hypothetical protein
LAEYYRWDGREDADWEITGVERIENIEEDRVIIYPKGEYFVCEIDVASDTGAVTENCVHCWSE